MCVALATRPSLVLQKPYAEGTGLTDSSDCIFAHARLSSSDSVARIAPSVIFNKIVNAIFGTVCRLYSNPAVLHTITGIESETNKTSSLSTDG